MKTAHLIPPHVRPTARDHAQVRAALASAGIKLTIYQRRPLAQAVADARAHGYSGHEECGYNTCKCSACIAEEKRR
jgi:hypothetical protein